VYNLRNQVSSHASFNATISNYPASMGLKRVGEAEALAYRSWHMLFHSFIQTKVLALCSFLGPLEKMPFNGDIIHLLTVLTVALFFGILSNKAGMLFTEHPDCPRTSMLPCVVQSAMNSARIIDNLTDLSTIRILVAQVCF
jgi:hypothetical protein